MDKTVEILVVVVVALIAATIVIFLLTDQTDGFAEFVGDSTEDSECRIAEAQFGQSLTCDGTDFETGEYQEIYEEHDHCDWAQDFQGAVEARDSYCGE